MTWRRTPSAPWPAALSLAAVVALLGGCGEARVRADQLVEKVDSVEEIDPDTASVDEVSDSVEQMREQLDALQAVTEGRLDSAISIAAQRRAGPLGSGDRGWSAGAGSRPAPGPAPDAMMALARPLATLHDAAGDVAVAAVSSGEWTGADLSAADFEASAGLFDGVVLAGTGSIGSQLWARPSISAIGVDMTSISGSSNVMVPEARARPEGSASR